MIVLAGDHGALCLSCADLDHLTFLPPSNAALTRRARKYSTLAAGVLKWTTGCLARGLDRRRAIASVTSSTVCWHVGAVDDCVLWRRGTDIVAAPWPLQCLALQLQCTIGGPLWTIRSRSVCPPRWVGRSGGHPAASDAGLQTSSAWGAPATDTKPADRAKHLIGSLSSGVPDLAERHREYVLAALKHAR
jgi:hypothetical protein